MVITVTCPSCSTSFPVDPAKIPEGGVNARCSACGDIFRVEKPVEPEPLPTLEDFAPDEPEESPPPSAPPPEPAAPASDPFAQAAPFERDAPEIGEVELPGFEAEEFTPAPEPTEPLPPPVPAEPTPTTDNASVAPSPQPPADSPAAPEADEEIDESSGPVQGFTFGKRDPTDKAKRLARVLVSDMIMYNAERHQSALAQGTLQQDFEEEIEKSWKEFVEQVGPELANGEGRTFWKDALNDILAKGEKVF